MPSGITSLHESCATGTVPGLQLGPIAPVHLPLWLNRRNLLAFMTRLQSAASYRRRLLAASFDRLLGPKDCRRFEDNPLRAVRRYKGRGEIVEVPLQKCRTFGVIGFPPTPQSCHPYVLTAMDYLAGRLSGYAGSPLEAYYESVQPRTAADLLGLPGVAALQQSEALEGELPWISVSGPEVKKKREKLMASDSGEFGPSLTLDDGWNFIGPVSPAKAELEIQRILAVLGSIAKEGYRVRTPLDHVWGFLLRDGEEYVAIIWGSEHRVPVLAALGYESVPLLFFPHRMADRCNVDAWPAVRTGMLRREDALQVFDRIMKGDLPEHVRTVWPPRGEAFGRE